LVSRQKLARGMLDITRGTCHVLFAYDIAFSIDLNEAERRIKD